MTANIVGPSQRDFDPSNPLSSFVDVLRRIVLHPVVFFAEIPRREGLRNPFLFALICIVIGAVLNAVVGLSGLQSPLQSSEGSQSSAGLVAYIASLAIIGIIALPVVAGLYQLLVGTVVGHENAGFEGTFRVVAYASVVNLVIWIPMLGLLLGLYSLYLQVVGLREIHQTTTGRAILVLLLFLVATIMIGVWIGLMLAYILIS